MTHTGSGTTVLLIEEALRRHGRARFVAQGGSMRPFLPPGTPVEVRAGLRPRIGDVALVRAGGRWVAHRMVARGEGYWVTRGDALGHCDPPVADRDVLGVVTAAFIGPLRVSLRGPLAHACGWWLSGRSAGRLVPWGLRAIQRLRAALRLG